MAESDAFYMYFYSGHKGKFGHEFFKFEIDEKGRLNYSNDSKYRRDSLIEKSLKLSPTMLNEIKRIVEDSEIMNESDDKWPRRDDVNGRVQLEIVIGKRKINFETAKIGSLSDIVNTQDPEGLRVLYYLIQDFKCLIMSLISLHFKIKPIA
ncbi:hypothetical protein GGI03_002136 [Coemansia sp. RSA 2337]|nr:hypothetical protein LPJ71_001079 [Coemansia sp. S17]KAJ2015282.1 hypothetical protein GGI14_004366 [Coemansia sp. S680]KAJ2053293.1 hypothetical protein H4S04_000765 [Coemansia sp. S16]KAJ2075795.1 hypothetical protein GGI09_008559 [Coemansia sp. S100]KAJ2097691.1 hypothetical protein GGI16_004495 [Coemansia sp. S142-1]KAJ2114925.1 hypothetical protein IW146_002702 [Coemansia sp. RSA 922]KAJ2332037.1 hypothetical protein GGH92_009044 [Coemansia sp. RSA 2673]KAJ2466393.1 hypothetical prot